MTSTLTVDIFLSVDGWAGSDGLPPYFGYFGPDLDEWISTHLEEPQLVIMGRRTYEVLAAIPHEARDESWRRMTELGKVVFSRTLQEAEWENTTALRPGSRRGGRHGSRARARCRCAPSAACQSVDS